MLNIKLIIAAIGALLIIGIAAYIGIQNKRIDLLKAENAALRVSLESAEDVIVKQNESITALMSQLSQSDSACRKQLEARNKVKVILNTKPPVVQAQPDVAFSRPASHLANQTLEILNDDQNIDAINYLNDLFLVRTADGL